MPSILPLNLCCSSNLSRRRELHKWFTLFLTFVIYTAYHMSRKPISVVKNSHNFYYCNSTTSGEDICSSFISEVDGTSAAKSKNMLGVIDSSYLFSYAVFMFVSGWIAERMDLRYFLSGGMFLSGVCVFFFGFAYTVGIHSYWYLIALQVLSGAVQSTGWPGVVTVLANWFGKGRRGLIMGIWNSHTSIGNIVGNTIAAVFVEDNWGLSFIVPGIIMSALGVLMFFILVPTPAQAGFVDEEEQGQEKKKVEEEKKEEEKAVGILEAARIPGVMEFSLCLFFAKLVAYTFLYWLPNYIHIMYKVDAEQAGILADLFDVGGIVGGITCGILSDRTRKPATTCGIMLMMAVPCLFIYQALVKDWCPITAEDGAPLKDSCFWWNVAMTMIVGFFVNGPYCLITTAVSAELGQHPSLQGSSKALATVTALIDGTGSIGAAVGPLLAGALSSNDNWDNVFYMLIASDVIALILLTRIIVREVRQILGK